MEKFNFLKPHYTFLSFLIFPLISENLITNWPGSLDPPLGNCGLNRNFLSSPWILSMFLLTNSCSTNNVPPSYYFSNSNSQRALTAPKFAVTLSSNLGPCDLCPWSNSAPQHLREKVSFLFYSLASKWEVTHRPHYPWIQGENFSSCLFLSWAILLVNWYLCT